MLEHIVYNRMDIRKLLTLPQNCELQKAESLIELREDIEIENPIPDP